MDHDGFDKSSNTLQARDTESGVKALWRGERGRTPEDVKKAGGFVSRGLQVLQGTNTRFSNLTFQEKSLSVSLLGHHYGGTEPYSQYVSTTELPTVAESLFAPSAEPGVPRFVYKIYAGARAIDMNKSLPEGGMFSYEREYVVAGFIPYEMIEGWYELSPGKTVFNMINKDPTKYNLDPAAKFQKNPAFKEKYRAQKDSGALSQLGGYFNEECGPETYDPELTKSFEDFIAKTGVEDGAAESALYKGFGDKTGDTGKRCKRTRSISSLKPKSKYLMNKNWETVRLAKWAW
ncbi:hypothetical protein ABW20_dc0108684 [Dactylellina cionopaga]|nr:hypothetical protein ABW20_dc0108684 [Dactylellina cionopaga]